MSFSHRFKATNGNSARAVDYPVNYRIALSVLELMHASHSLLSNCVQKNMEHCFLASIIHKI